MPPKTDEQQTLLKAIEQEAARLEFCQQQTDTTRRHLWELMAQAKEVKTSSYAIAEAAKISQPRVMQVIQEYKGIPKATKKGPQKKELLEQVAALQQELQQVQHRLYREEGPAVALCDEEEEIS